MSRRFARGLVVGKFSPLHRGHELVIRRAAGECGEVVVLSYSKPEFPRCGPAQRRRWLEALFPEATRLVIDGHDEGVPANDAPAEVHRGFVADVLRDHGLRIDAVFTSESYGDGFACSLELRQRAWDPASGSVTHVCVDLERTTVPVSGTRLRSGSRELASFLSAVVRADMVLRVCLLGGESTGKTTLARALGQALEEPWVDEYGRELWELRQGRLAFEDLRHIAEEQVRREDVAAGRASRFLFCDTSPLTTLFYSLEMFGRADPALEALAQRRYDLTLLCADDFAFSQDGTRREPGFRAWGQAWYREQLGSRGLEWVDVRGTLAERIGQVVSHLEDRFTPAVA